MLSYYELARKEYIRIICAFSRMDNKKAVKNGSFNEEEMF